MANFQKYSFARENARRAHCIRELCILLAVTFDSVAELINHPLSKKEMPSAKDVFEATAHLAIVSQMPRADRSDCWADHTGNLCVNILENFDASKPEEVEKIRQRVFYWAAGPYTEARQDRIGLAKDARLAFETENPHFAVDAVRPVNSTIASL